MRTGSRRRLSVLTALGWSAGLPAAVFLVLIAMAPKAQIRLPSPVLVDRAGMCGEARVEVVSSACDIWEPGAIPPRFSCSPGGLRERDWTAMLRLRAPAAAACTYDLLIVDSPRNDITTRSPRYPHAELAVDDPGSYRLHGKPWRTYAVAPMWQHGEQTGFAGELILVGFYQRQGQGLNIRGSALLEFAGEIALALAVLLVLYRAYARRLARTGSWAAVATLSATGGGSAGILFMLRPADLGGYDERPGLVTIIVCSAVMACVIGMTGCWFAWLRASLDRLSVARRLLLISLVMPFVALMTTGLGTKWSAYSSPGAVETWVHFRIAYYAYHASSIALSLVLFHGAKTRSDDAGEFHIRFRKLFGVTAFCSVLAILVALAAGELLRVATPGQIYRGFYKPASGLGLWVVSLFAIAGLSAAQVVGRQPKWIQDLNENLSQFADESDPSVRLRCRKRAVLGLLSHLDLIEAARHHLAFAARQAPRLIQGLLDDQVELRQLVAELERDPAMSGLLGALREEHLDRVRNRLVVALEKLAKIDRNETKLEIPLLMIDEETQQFVQGRLAVTRFLDPGARRNYAVDVCQQGTQLEIEHKLCARVRAVVDVVNEEVIKRIRPGALDRHRIEVDFQFDRNVDLSGQSYELPIALAIVGLLEGVRPLWERWAATGRLKQPASNIAVQQLPIKCRFLEDGQAVLISGANAVAASRAQLSNHIWCAIAEDQYDVEQLRREVLSKLSTQRTAVLLGVTTLHQAVEVFYDARLQPRVPGLDERNVTPRTAQFREIDRFRSG